MAAILLALASMACAAVNDYIFKLYARKTRPIGFYMAVIGIVWTACFALAAGPHRILTLTSETLAWGLFSGLLSALANILLIEALTRHEVGTCATIYRLNLAPAALLAFLLLNEAVTPFKLLAIAAAVVSVLLFFSSTPTQPQVRFSAGLLLVAVAALLRAGMGIAYKAGLQHHADPLIFLALNGFMWIVAGSLYHAVMLRRKTLSSQFTSKSFSYGLLSGLLICGLTYFMMAALRRGDASVVLPVAQLSFLLTSIIGVIFLKELFNLRKAAALGAAVVCIVLMSLNA